MLHKWKTIKDNMKKKKFWGQVLAGFFVLMAVCTVIARAADSMTVPKAKVKSPSSGHLNYKIEGNGSVKASEGTLIIIPEKLRISQTVPVGSMVEVGTPVGVCNMEELQKIIEEEQAKLQKLTLQLQQEQKNGSPDAVTPQTLPAGKALDLAKDQYADAEAALSELRQNKQQEADLRQQETEAEKQRLSDELAAAGEEDAEAKAAYEEQIQALDEKNTQEEQNAQTEIQAQEEKLEALRQALQQAQSAYEIAQQEDANNHANRQKSAESSKLVQQGIQIDIEQQQKVVEKLNEIAAAQGQLVSPVKGSVSETTLKEGMITSGQEYIRIGTGGYRFQASVDADDLKLLKTGDTIQIQFQGKTQRTSAKVSELLAASQEGNDGTGAQDGSEGVSGGNSQGNGAGASQNSTGQIIAELSEGEYSEGMSGEYTIEKESDIRYDWILPVSAVKEDQKGSYCLVVKKKSTILGEEDVAERVNLTTKAKDVNQIAVEGVLTSDSQVITESTKSIEEGDRFRIEHEK